MRDFLCLRIWRRESGAESLAQRRADLAPGLDHSLDHSLDGAMRPPALLLLPALLALLPGLELGLSAGPEPSLRASVWDRSPDPEPTDSKPLCRCSWFLVKLRLKDCGPENQISTAATRMKPFYLDVVRKKQRRSTETLLCSKTPLRLELPLGLRAVGRSTGAFTVTQKRRNEDLIEENSQTQDADPDFEVFYLDWKRKLCSVLGKCSSNQRPQKEKRTTANSDLKMETPKLEKILTEKASFPRPFTHSLYSTKAAIFSVSDVRKNKDIRAKNVSLFMTSFLESFTSLSGIKSTAIPTIASTSTVNAFSSKKASTNGVKIPRNAASLTMSAVFPGPTKNAFSKIAKSAKTGASVNGMGLGNIGAMSKFSSTTTIMAPTGSFSHKNAIKPAKATGRENGAFKNGLIFKLTVGNGARRNPASLTMSATYAHSTNRIRNGPFLKAKFTKRSSRNIRSSSMNRNAIHLIPSHISSPQTSGFKASKMLITASSIAKTNDEAYLQIPRGKRSSGRKNKQVSSIKGKSKTVSKTLKSTKKVPILKAKHPQTKTLSIVRKSADLSPSPQPPSSQTNNKLSNINRKTKNVKAKSPADKIRKQTLIIKRKNNLKGKLPRGKKSSIKKNKKSPKRRVQRRKKKKKKKRRKKKILGIKTEPPIASSASPTSRNSYPPTTTTATSIAKIDKSTSTTLSTVGEKLTSRKAASLTMSAASAPSKVISATTKFTKNILALKEKKKSPAKIKKMTDMKGKSKSKKSSKNVPSLNVKPPKNSQRKKIKTKSPKRKVPRRKKKKKKKKPRRKKKTKKLKPTDSKAPLVPSASPSYPPTITNTMRHVAETRNPTATKALKLSSVEDNETIRNPASLPMTPAGSVPNPTNIVPNLKVQLVGLTKGSRQNQKLSNVKKGSKTKTKKGTVSKAKPTRKKSSQRKGKRTKKGKPKKKKKKSKRKGKSKTTKSLTASLASTSEVRTLPPTIDTPATSYVFQINNASSPKAHTLSTEEYEQSKSPASLNLMTVLASSTSADSVTKSTTPIPALNEKEETNRLSSIPTKSKVPTKKLSNVKRKSKTKKSNKKISRKKKRPTKKRKKSKSPKCVCVTVPLPTTTTTTTTTTAKPCPICPIISTLQSEVPRSSVTSMLGNTTTSPAATITSTPTIPATTTPATTTNSTTNPATATNSITTPTATATTTTTTTRATPTTTSTTTTSATITSTQFAHATPKHAFKLSIVTRVTKVSQTRDSASGSSTNGISAKIRSTKTMSTFHSEVPRRSSMASTLESTTFADGVTTTSASDVATTTVPPLSHATSTKAFELFNVEENLSFVSSTEEVFSASIKSTKAVPTFQSEVPRSSVSSSLGSFSAPPVFKNTDAGTTVAAAATTQFVHETPSNAFKLFDGEEKSVLQTTEVSMNGENVTSRSPASSTVSAASVSSTKMFSKSTNSTKTVPGLKSEVPRRTSIGSTSVSFAASHTFKTSADAISTTTTAIATTTTPVATTATQLAHATPSSAFKLFNGEVNVIGHYPVSQTTEAVTSTNLISETIKSTKTMPSFQSEVLMSSMAMASTSISFAASPVIKDTDTITTSTTNSASTATLFPQATLTKAFILWNFPKNVTSQNSVAHTTKAVSPTRVISPTIKENKTKFAHATPKNDLILLNFERNVDDQDPVSQTMSAASVSSTKVTSTMKSNKTLSTFQSEIPRSTASSSLESFAASTEITNTDAGTTVAATTQFAHETPSNAFKLFNGEENATNVIAATMKSTKPMSTFQSEVPRGSYMASTLVSVAASPLIKNTATVTSPTANATSTTATQIAQATPTNAFVFPKVERNVTGHLISPTKKSTKTMFTFQFEIPRSSVTSSLASISAAPLIKNTDAGTTTTIAKFSHATPSDFLELSNTEENINRSSAFSTVSVASVSSTKMFLTSIKSPKIVPTLKSEIPKTSMGSTLVSFAASHTFKTDDAITTTVTPATATAIQFAHTTPTKALMLSNLENNVTSQNPVSQTTKSASSTNVISETIKLTETMSTFQSEVPRRSFMTSSSFADGVTTSNTTAAAAAAAAAIVTVSSNATIFLTRLIPTSSSKFAKVLPTNKTMPTSKAKSTATHSPKLDISTSSSLISTKQLLPEITPIPLPTMQQSKNQSISAHARLTKMCPCKCLRRVQTSTTATTTAAAAAAASTSTTQFAQATIKSTKTIFTLKSEVPRGSVSSLHEFKNTFSNAASTATAVSIESIENNKSTLTIEGHGNGRNTASLTMSAAVLKTNNTFSRTVTNILPFEKAHDTTSKDPMQSTRLTTVNVYNSIQVLPTNEKIPPKFVSSISNATSSNAKSITMHSPKRIVTSSTRNSSSFLTRLTPIRISKSEQSLKTDSTKVLPTNKTTPITSIAPKTTTTTTTTHSTTFNITTSSSLLLTKLLLSVQQSKKATSGSPKTCPCKCSGKVQAASAKVSPTNKVKCSKCAVPSHSNQANYIISNSTFSPMNTTSLA